MTSHRGPRRLVVALALAGLAASAASPNVPALKVDGPLDARVVQTVIATHSDQVKACYDDFLASHPTTEGMLLLHWAVKDDGSVEEACQSRGTTVPAELGRCVSERVMHWLFPAPGFGARAEVEYAFVFAR